ncbi:unnamed protein product [Didymodactylos carnosus]|uniref:Uncharacterized protein n=1 Tax=Didymodactylos carnosus TaxID=1234261 RepID=A0A816EBW7_9BILA|nr:unnamed protein product [Didymodactylos carnosus]CAF4564440.1 unnamed protein product [Didymodactylos carnosus]
MVSSFARYNFDFIQSYCEPSFSIEKFQSKKSKIKLYCIRLPELPTIKVELCVQTKPYDDTGVAHTLEHLIFMGSKNYPQQGILDYISSYLYCTGTNASTYRDMTNYELSTIDKYSILKLLPIYLDHIFNPLLTNDCYLTEIHHINNEGHDSGVVYSEMQSCEQQADEILEQKLMSELWSKTSHYHYNYGGKLESIRTSLSLDKIKSFHKMFYTPKNVAIIVSGNIEPDDIMNVIYEFEQQNEKRITINSTIHASNNMQHKRKKR